VPILLPVFGAVSLASVPANIVAAPLVVVAMPLAALAGLAGLLWWPLGEVVAAPAILAVDALIAVIDVLGASETYVNVGVPPMGAAVIVAATGAALLVALMADAARFGNWARLANKEANSRPAGEWGEFLSPAAPLIFAREDPLHSLGADPDDAEEQPAGEEDRHEVADVR
jgi:hypothetical protein